MTSKLHSDRINAIRLAWVQTYNENTDNEPVLRAAREDMKYLLEQYESAEHENQSAHARIAELEEQLEAAQREAQENYEAHMETSVRLNAVMSMLEAERPPDEVFAYARSLSNPASEPEAS